MHRPRIKAVEPLEDKCLRIEYETGEVRIFDVKPYIFGNWFGELNDDNYFKTVHILPGGIGIEWANGQDIAPHELYEQSVTLANLV